MSLQASHQCWSWMIIGCSFLIHVLLCGIMYSSGVVYIYLHQEYPDASHVELAAAFAIQLTTATCTGIVGAVIVYHFGVRWSVVLGGIITTAGFMLWAACQQLYQVYFTMSLLAGIGMGLSVTPSIMILDWYFEAHQREMVIGLAVSGTSVGTAVMPVLIRKVEEIFGVEEVGLIIGFVCITVSGLGTVMRQVKGAEIQHPPNLLSTFARSAIADRNFLILCAGNFLWCFGISVIHTFLPLYAVHIGHTIDDCILLISIIGLSGFCSRIFFTFFTHTSKLDKGNAFFCTFLIAFLLTGLFPHMFALGGGKYGYAMLLGIHIGCWTVYVYTISIEDIGAATLASGKGWITVSVGCGLGAGPLVSGLILDLLADYDIIFYTAGTCLCVSSLLLITIDEMGTKCYLMMWNLFCAKRYRRKMKKARKETETLVQGEDSKIFLHVTTV